MDPIEARNNIYKISIDMEQLAYKISHLEDEIAKLFASVEEIKGREYESRRMVT